MNCFWIFRPHQVGGGGGGGEGVTIYTLVFVQSIFADRYIHRRVVSGIIRKPFKRRIGNKKLSIFFRGAMETENFSEHMMIDVNLFSYKHHFCTIFCLAFVSNCFFNFFPLKYGKITCS